MKHFGDGVNLFHFETNWPRPQMFQKINEKNLLKPVDFNEKLLYNSRACKICDEVRCGYNLWNNRVGGNSYGVCRGLDQGGKLFKSINNKYLK